jgi:rhamnosyltransferase
MNKYCAGIVIYNPNEFRLRQVLSKLTRVDVKLFLYLNSDLDFDFIDELHQINISILGTKQNEGLGKGLNEISYNAINDGYEWLLVLDQDSVIDEKVFEQYSIYLDMENLGLISPVVVEENLKSYIHEKYQREYEFILNHITSGSYIKLEYLKKMGMFEEQFFIDSLDTDLAIRLNLNGIRQIRVNSVKMYHQTGMIEVSNLKIIRKEDSSFRFKNLIKTNHSNERIRFIFRNYILMMRKYSNFVFRDTRLLFRLIYKPWLKSLILLILVEKNKLTKLRFFLSGTIEAFRIKIEKYKF